MKNNNSFQKWLDRKGRQIIKENRYLTLATSDKHCNPWAAAIAFDRDAKFNFYFVSSIDSLHMRHISKNSKVAITIFDSHKRWLKTDSVQMKGTAKIIENKRELLKALRLYNASGHSNKYSSIDEFRPPLTLRFLKINISKAYTMNTKATHKDQRGRLEFNLIR